MSKPDASEKYHWKPFKLALDSQFSNYTEFAVNYPFKASGQRAQIENDNLSPAARAYEKRDFAKLDSLIRPGVGAFAEMIHRNLEPLPPQRPVNKGVHINPDYMTGIETRLRRLKGPEKVPKIRKIKTAVQELRKSNIDIHSRGDMYQVAKRFEESWPLVRLWVDEIFSGNIQNQYDILTRAATTHTVPQNHFSDLEYFVGSYLGNNIEKKYNFLKEEATSTNDIKTIDPSNDFKTIWELSRHEEFQISATETRNILYSNAPYQAQAEQLEKHLILITKHATELHFNSNYFRRNAQLLTKYGETAIASSFLLINLAASVDNPYPPVEFAGYVTDSIQGGSDSVVPPLQYKITDWAARYKKEETDKLKKEYGNLLRYHLRRKLKLPVSWAYKI